MPLLVQTPPILVGVLVVLARVAGGGEDLTYNRDVRPILAENCFACHGPDSAARQADLRLDQRQAAIDAGAIVPGQPEDSQGIVRLFSDDPDELMPPPSTHKVLTAAQKELLRKWVAAGAEYQAHWSLIPPQRPAVPAVGRPAWGRNPIDAFVLAGLEASGLQPAPEADRRTLARRLALDLTGLPPAPADVDAFVADTAPEADERFVDRLLDSPHWGEHRARYWLDAARYADTHGLHFDNYREIWSYRDWVIQAFQRNLPFDQFTIEQLAGDLLPDPSLDQLVASGFHRCQVTTNEGGTIPEENLVHYTRDRTETTAQVWLGLTANCAVCHDHKFDPITQREFYQLAAFFNNTTQGAMDGNIKDSPPIMPLPSPPDRPRAAALEAELAAARQQLDARKAAARGDFDAWLGSGAAGNLAECIPATGLQLHLGLAEDSGPLIRFTLDGQPQETTLAAAPAREAGYAAAQAVTIGSEALPEIAQAGDFDKDQPFSCAAWVKLGSGTKSGALLARMDDQAGYRGWDLWVEDGRVGSHVVHHWEDDALKVVTINALQNSQWTHVVVSYDGSGKAAGVKVYWNGQPQPTRVLNDRLQNTIRTQVPLKIGQRHTASRLVGTAIGDVRVYSRAVTAAEAEQLAQGSRAAWLAAKPAGQRTPAETDELYAGWLASADAAYRQLSEQIAALTQEQTEIQARSTVAYVMRERPEPAKAFVLFRGEYDQRREAVEAGTFACLPPWPDGLPKNRLGLAQWLLRPEQPLTARVTVNRFWQEVFGQGLVPTAGDFGVSGELPSHPELLDWLAVEFRESGWDVKKFFRLLVNSAAYRQAVEVTPAKLERDPQNRLLSRGPRFRMDAEMVRDYALAASGLLVRKIGGSSVKPYQPAGVWEAVAMIGSNTRDYRPDSGENLYRRSLYTFWKRSAPPASLEVFNAPSREFCTVRRERTNTPLQALVTLNDPQFVEAARFLAQRALREGGAEDDHRLDFLANQLLVRAWRSEELPIVQRSLRQLREFYQAHPEEARKLLAVGESKPDAALDAAALAAWTMLVNQLLNLDEVLNK